MLLNCHTYYSFCYGTLTPEELLDEVQRNGYTSLVLTDINNTSAVLDTIRLAAPRNIKVLVGVDFRNGIQQQYIGIAKNNRGFKELNEHLSLHLHQNKPFENRAPFFEEVLVVYPLKSYTGFDLQEHEYIGIAAVDLLRWTYTAAKKHASKLVVLQPVTFILKKHFNAHRLLRAIDKNTLLSKLTTEEQGSPNETMPTKAALYESFKSMPQVIRNTEYILETCSVVFEYGKFSNKNLLYYTDSIKNDLLLLRSLCEQGLPRRYPVCTPVVLQRMEKELQVIEQMNFASYFLINWDILQYAQHKNYFYVGRGSGANSLVAYLLKITDVDPIELDLYFERFINPFRSNPPDFDIDFSWTDRDDVTRYIFERFGRERTALLAVYATFQQDSVVRELGKVFGLPAPEIDRLQQAKVAANTDSMGRLVLQYSQLIHGFPSHLSVHSSGILISELPITCYSATFLPPKGYPTTQFSMLEAEDIGLCKFDILSQRGLGKIKDTVTLVQQNRNVSIDIHDIPRFKQDPLVKRLLSEGNCIGCFYIESPAMRMLLAKLQADDYLRLVAASSIIRPGVSKSGMMAEYIKRYRSEALQKKAREELPELYDLLAETYGVMVYQEDVIKVAHHIAGLSLAEADYLRRGMSWKFKQRNEFMVVRENFFKNCRAKGYPEQKVNDIWIQIESFANYAFSKAHSASYAVESFQALYLKAYYPLEYMVATLNNGGGFYRTEFYVHEARIHGAQVVPPCVNNSEADSRIVGEVIYLGFAMIQELEQATIAAILKERTAFGSFHSLHDFIKRVPISIEQVRLLIKVGGFLWTAKNKKVLLWEAAMLVRPTAKQRMELFETSSPVFKLPYLHSSYLDDAFDEIELLGFPLLSPFYLLKEPCPSSMLAADLRTFINQNISIAGYLVTAKRTYTSKGERMYFGTFIDQEGAWIDTVHFPAAAKAFPFTGPGCYLLTGKVVVEFDFLYVEVNRMHRLSTKSWDDIDRSELAVEAPKQAPWQGLKISPIS
jgi:DNA polymerase III subunit alpha